jgi:hypothetical protein
VADLIPSLITAGVTFRVSLVLPVYPAPAWSVSLVLRGPGAIDLAAVGVLETHTFEALPAVTSAWVPGAYWYEVRATDGADVSRVEEGQTNILADLSVAQAGFDGRSHVQRVLDAIEAVIEGRASVDQESYSINNRSLSRTPISDLLKLRDRYRSELSAASEAKAGRRLGRIHKVRFS